MRIHKFVFPNLDLALNRNILLVFQDVLDVDEDVNCLDRYKKIYAEEESAPGMSVCYSLAVSRNSGVNKERMTNYQNFSCFLVIIFLILF